MGLAGQQWVFLSYSLALAALYLVGGAVGDRYGRRDVFIAGVAGFAVASTLAGAAPNECGAHSRAHAPGRGRRVRDDELARAPARRLRRRGRARHRALDGVHERGDDRGPACRGRARGVGLVALDLLHQPAARCYHGRARAPGTLRRAHRRPRRPARPPRRSARRTRVRPPHLRTGGRRRERLRRHLVGVCRRRRRAGRLRRRRAPHGRADAALRALPPAQLRRRERRDLPRLRRAVRVLRLLHALPPVPRLHAVRGRPDQCALERRHDPARGPFRDARRPTRPPALPHPRAGAHGSRAFSCSCS